MASFKFPNIFNKDRKICDTISGDENYDQSLSLLVSTAQNELLMDPSYGGGFYEYLFEKITDPMVDVLTDIFISKVNTYIPEISIKKEDVTYTQEDTKVKMNIVYSIISQPEDFKFFDTELQSNSYISF